MYWHQRLSILIPFLSPNTCDWLIHKIHDHDWLKVIVGIQNVPKQNFQDSNYSRLIDHNVFTTNLYELDQMIG